MFGKQTFTQRQFTSTANDRRIVRLERLNESLTNQSNKTYDSI